MCVGQGLFVCMCVGAWGGFGDEGERLKIYRHVLYINEFAVEN